MLNQTQINYLKSRIQDLERKVETKTTFISTIQCEIDNLYLEIGALVNQLNVDIG